MAIYLVKGEHGTSFTPPAATGIFDDAKKTYCLAPWIEQLYADGFTAGCAASPLRYCPHSTLSRAEMAVFLLRLKHGISYQPPACTGVFADVACPGHWSANWVEQLYAEGITAGCAANPLRFCPDNRVPRDQMAVFLTGTLGLP